jgi:protein ImuA
MPLPAHLDTALLDAALWTADSLGRASTPTCASGHALLDAELPGGGWPGGALTELLLAPLPSGLLCARGELRLLGPALVRLGSAGSDIVLVAPPLQLHAPALAAWGWPLPRLLLVEPAGLADAAWAAEQALRSRRCAAVVWWTPAAPLPRATTALLRLALRRLHLAAHDSTSLLFVLRDAASAAQSSPAPLRLLCEPDPASTLHLQVRLLKRRGPPCAAALRLERLGPANAGALMPPPRPAASRPPPALLHLPHALAVPGPAAAAA